MVQMTYIFEFLLVSICHGLYPASKSNHTYDMLLQFSTLILNIVFAYLCLFTNTANRHNFFPTILLTATDTQVYPILLRNAAGQESTGSLNDTKKHFNNNDLLMTFQQHDQKHLQLQIAMST